jgi:hypothetical protein
VHLAFILFVAAGALLTWRWPRVAWAHLPALAWAVGSVTVGFPCPLTGLEKALRRRSDGHAYDGGFVDQYLEGVLYPQELSSRLRALAGVVILIGYFGGRRRRRIHGRPARDALSGLRDPGSKGGAASRLSPGPRPHRRTARGPRVRRSPSQW